MTGKRPWNFRKLPRKTIQKITKEKEPLGIKKIQMQIDEQDPKNKNKMQTKKKLY